MEFGNKMMVVPMDQQINNFKRDDNKGTHLTSSFTNDHVKPKKNYKTRATERFNKALKIILALAKIGGYDDAGRIRSGDSFLENSDIVSLIHNVISPRKNLIGEREFVDLLVEAKLDPSLITNESVKYRLLNSRNVDKNITVSEREPIVRSNQKGLKRPAEEENDEEPLQKKKLSNWTIPYDSDDDW